MDSRQWKCRSYLTALRRRVLVSFQGIVLIGAGIGEVGIEKFPIPREWMMAIPMDPKLPMSGRRVSLRLLAAASTATWVASGRELSRSWPIRLWVKDGQVQAERVARSGVFGRVDSGGSVYLDLPIQIFIPADISLEPGETVFVQVELPPFGLPKPLRVMKRIITFL